MMLMDDDEVFWLNSTIDDDDGTNSSPEKTNSAPATTSATPQSDVEPERRQ
jgi:hypothetical protein